MILNGKYTEYRSFIVNRLLKLFPAYWVVLALCVYFSPPKLAALPPLWWAFYTLSNTFMLGSHFTSAIVEQAGQLTWLPFSTPLNGQEMSWKYLYIGPVWSLSVELLFYLIAPFVVTRAHFRYKMAAMLAVSAGACAFLLSRNAWTVPWSYNFLLPNLVFFMLGACAYRFYVSGAFQRVYSVPAACCALLLQTLYVVGYQFVPNDVNVQLVNINIDKVALGVLLFSTTIPLVFELARRSKIDRFLGDLSYPVYVSHFLFIGYFPYWRELHPLVGTLVLSVALDLLVIKTIDRYRARLVK
jgi:peptidoglycan/LPS O-acetylase OafA/YrhL